MAIFKLNKLAVKKAREVIEKKRPYWESKLGLKFDNDGRVVVGNLSVFEESDCRSIVLSQTSDFFDDCLKKSLKAQGFKPFRVKDIPFSSWTTQRTNVTKEGKKSIKKLPFLLKRLEIEWNKECDKKLDIIINDDGSLSVGANSNYTQDELIETIESYKFNSCFEDALSSINIVPFSFKKISIEDWKKKEIEVQEKDKELEKSIMSLLQAAQNIWEAEFEIYRDFRNHTKELREEGESPGELQKLTDIINRMIRTNSYYNYDRLLREFQEKPFMISINPLDKLFSSGGNGDSFSETLTKFNSCWSNKITKESDDCYEITEASCYANPHAQYSIGSHLCCGMVIIPNGSTITVSGMVFHGMLQRSHIWLSQEGLFVENIYPDKYNKKRIKEINDILSTRVNVYIPNEWTTLTIGSNDFNVDEWFNDFKSKTARGRRIYLDRSAIHGRTGNILVGPNFRYHSHGGDFLYPGTNFR